MGILVNDATLPSGIQLSNVYMSFSGEPVYVVPTQTGWRINSSYNVFRDSSKMNGSNIRIPLATTTSNIAEGSAYSFLYAALKEVYPNFIDSIE